MTLSPNAIDGLEKPSLELTALSRAGQPYAGLQQLLSCSTVDRTTLLLTDAAIYALVAAAYCP